MANYAVNTDSANFELGLFAVKRALETFVGEIVNLVRRAIGHTSHKGPVLESFRLNPAKVRDVPSDDHRTGPFAFSEGLGNQQYRLLAICTCQHLDLNPVAAFDC